MVVVVDITALLAGTQSRPGKGERTERTSAHAGTGMPHMYEMLNARRKWEDLASTLCSHCLPKQIRCFQLCVLHATF